MLFRSVVWFVNLFVMGLLKLMGIRVQRADRAEEVEDTVAAALDSAFMAGESMAVLLSQRLIGAKVFVK